MNYTYILPELVVGSVPQTTEDINHLSEKVGITAILNLQHQCDWEKFGIDFGALQHRCHERGDIKIVRCPIEDFSSASLCKHLPKAVYALQSLLEEGHKVYIHCTAGLGRAPAVAIGHLHWRYSMTLEDSYRHVTSRRNCHPKAAAIRQATLALSMGNEGAVNFSWTGNARKVQVHELPFPPVDRQCTQSAGDRKLLSMAVASPAPPLVSLYKSLLADSLVQPSAASGVPV
ncbi:hypothetical protein CYMTET_28448 [Cymbomonas tetramitiformis]|uniref:Tyrosine specific protein phosphatases domain-containing protein n=1 Tax=Cymbomonas tetramitiformis TaxID=36881 RepID=A0AAE0FNG8_9CHLO|nr:hypothetical protein CYMTET_28448 [Cymbomonas tetramitiformis]